MDEGVDSIDPVVFDELETLLQSRNALQLRTFFRGNLGVVAGSGQRLKVWSLLLVGEDLTNAKPVGEECDDDDDMGTPETVCEEHQVLLADVRRTRADMEEFRRPEWRKSLSDILHNYCLFQNIAYKQGLNEVLVPFVYLCPPGAYGTKRPYQLLDAFVGRYLERFYLVDDSLFLFKSFRFFHLLLLFYDPQLAIHLHAADFPPELYASPWFLTAYSRALPVPHVLRLFDFVLSVDDAAFMFFIGLVLVRAKRRQLLLSDASSIPEVITDLAFHSELEIDEVCKEAHDLYQATPRSFLRNLRLCCCATAELSPSAQRARISTAATTTMPGEASFLREDKAMAAQSARTCVTLTPREVVTLLSPTSTSGPDGARLSIVIDLRSSVEAREVGGGTLLNAIHMEPAFLDSEEFEVWLQHLDKLRGHNVNVIDMTPKKPTGAALWRRLLFGEGDGGSSSSSSRESARDSGHSRFTWSQRDGSSPFSEIEAAACEEDSERPAVRLARALQYASFPHVSVLDGGFSALVEHLLNTRGTVDGFVEGFHRDKWSRSMGRLNTPGAPRARFESDVLDFELGSPFSDGEQKIQRQLLELTEAARLQLSHTVAQRLGHKAMHRCLTERIDRLRRAEATNLLIQSVVDSHL